MIKSFNKMFFGKLVSNEDETMTKSGIVLTNSNQKMYTKVNVVSIPYDCSESIKNNVNIGDTLLVRKGGFIEYDDDIVMFNEGIIIAKI